MIKELQQEFHSKAFKLFIKMFEEDLKQNRDKLDTAEGNEMFKLQGSIRILKKYLALQTNREAKYTTHDGGYGVQ